jgi:hypothetical protein
VADTKESYIAQWSEYKKVYSRLANDSYPNTLKRIDK